MKQDYNHRERRRMPEEQRRKISAALRGKKRSPETKRALSNSLKRYWSSVVWDDVAKEGDA